MPLVAPPHSNLHYFHVGWVTDSTLSQVGSRWVHGGLSMPVLASCSIHAGGGGGGGRATILAILLTKPRR